MTNRPNIILLYAFCKYMHSSCNCNSSWIGVFIDNHGNMVNNDVQFRMNNQSYIQTLFIDDNTFIFFFLRLCRLEALMLAMEVP